MNLLDPALLAALLVGALIVVLYVRVHPPPPPVPRCKGCDREMERGETVIDPEHPEHRFISGQRLAWFKCPACGWRRQAPY